MSAPIVAAFAAYESIASLDAESLSKRITVLVSTSPIPSHPSTALISASLASVRSQLPCSRIIIMADGATEPNPDYNRYLESLRAQIASQNAAIFNFARVHQSGMLGGTLAFVGTPLILYWEHDWLLLPDIPWSHLAALILRGDFDYIKLHANPRVSPYYEHMMGERVMYQDGIPDDRHTDQRSLPVIPIIKTKQWSQNPHLASTQFYRDKILPLVAGKCDFIENIVHGLIANTYVWDDYRLGIFNPCDGDMMRVRHLDGKHTVLSQ